MAEYDAGYYEIQELQAELSSEGITKEELNLDDYAGLTYRELKGIVQTAVARKKKAQVQDAIIRKGFSDYGRPGDNAATSSQRPVDCTAG